MQDVYAQLVDKAMEGRKKAGKMGFYLGTLAGGIMLAGVGGEGRNLRTRKE